MSYTEKLNAKRRANQEVSPITSSNGKTNNQILNFTEESNLRQVFPINLN